MWMSSSPKAWRNGSITNQHCRCDWPWKGESPTAGVVLLAGTNHHLRLTRSQRLGYTEQPLAYVYRPSVNVFFESVARYWSGVEVGVLLTGMGRDGAEGLLRLREKGATTFAQDEASCVVYGMPKAAWENGAAQLQLPLDRISTYLTGRFDAAHRSVSTAAATP